MVVNTGHLKVCALFVSQPTSMIKRSPHLDYKTFVFKVKISVAKGRGIHIWKPVSGSKHSDDIFRTAGRHNYYSLLKDLWANTTTVALKFWVECVTLWSGLLYSSESFLPHTHQLGYKSGWPRNFMTIKFCLLRYCLSRGDLNSTIDFSINGLSTGG